MDSTNTGKHHPPNICVNQILEPDNSDANLFTNSNIYAIWWQLHYFVAKVIYVIDIIIDNCMKALLLTSGSIPDLLFRYALHCKFVQFFDVHDHNKMIDIPMLSKVKCYMANWKIMHTLQYVFHPNCYALCRLPTSSICIWYLKIIHGQMIWSKIGSHIWIPVCVSNKCM